MATDVTTAIGSSYSPAAVARERHLRSVGSDAQVADGQTDATTSPNAATPTPAGTPQPAIRPYWQTEACPPWCEAKHGAGDYFEDRHHYLIPPSIELGLYEYRDTSDRREHGPGEMQFAVEQHYRAAQPHIDMVVPTTATGRPHEVAGEQGVSLTLTEARAVRDGLTELLCAVAAAPSAASAPVLVQVRPERREGQLYEVNPSPSQGSSWAIRAQLVQWTERDSSPQLEVVIDIADIADDCTPEQARTAAARLHEIAGRITELADQADAWNQSLAPSQLRNRPTGAPAPIAHLASLSAA